MPLAAYIVREQAVGRLEYATVTHRRFYLKLTAQEDHEPSLRSGVQTSIRQTVRE